MTPAPAPDGYVISRAHEVRARNERIAAAARRHHFEHEAPVPFLCECSDERCGEFLRMTVNRYAAARGAADYLVVPGHQVDDANIVRVTDVCWLYRGTGSSPGQRRSR
jgi:hypothetical protein